MENPNNSCPPEIKKAALILKKLYQDSIIFIKHITPKTALFDLGEKPKIHQEMETGTYNVAEFRPFDSPCALFSDEENPNPFLGGSKKGSPSRHPDVKTSHCVMFSAIGGKPNSISVLGCKNPSLSRHVHERMRVGVSSGPRFPTPSSCSGLYSAFGIDPHTDVDRWGKKEEVVMCQKESFQIDADISEALAILWDRIFDMEYTDCVEAFDSYTSAAKQIDELVSYYNWCKDTGITRSSEFPEKLLETLKEEILRARAKTPDTHVEEALPAHPQEDEPEPEPSNGGSSGEPESGKADWELALVETARQKAALLSGMYDQQHVSTSQLNGASVAVLRPGKSTTHVLPLPGTVQTATSLTIPPPSCVRMAERLGVPSPTQSSSSGLYLAFGINPRTICCTNLDRWGKKVTIFRHNHASPSLSPNLGYYLHFRLLRNLKKPIRSEDDNIDLRNGQASIQEHHLVSTKPLHSVGRIL